MTGPPPLVYPPPGSLIDQLTSPAFATSPPDIRNAHLIPPDIAAAMAPAWSTRHFPERPVGVYRLDDVYVVGEGLVFDRDRALLAPSVTQHSPPEIAAALARLDHAIAAGTLVHDPGTTLLCQKRGLANFGHWLIELLPIAYLCLANVRTNGWSVLAPELPGRIGAVIRYSLAAIGVPGAAIRLGDGAPRRVDSLILVDGLTAHGYTISPLVLPALDALMAAVPADPPAPLWISRAGSPRSFWDEPDLERILSTLGWRILTPGSMPLHAQIAAFKGATRIAGVHGAGLTGLVFAPPGTPITTFAPAAMPDTFFWLLSALRGQAYREVRAPQAPVARGPTAWDATLLLSLPEVLAGLATLLV